MEKEVLVEVSARHVHLTAEQVEILFGRGYELTQDKMLSQPGQFLAKERVNIVGKKKELLNVAILGPVREAAQVELSLTDCFSIGVNGELRDSGNISGTSGIKIYTEKAAIELNEGVIAAQRHIHMTPNDALNFKVKDKQLVDVKISNGLGRSLIFSDVLIRVSDKYALAMHIDTDEANAARISGITEGFIIVN